MHSASAHTDAAVGLFCCGRLVVERVDFAEIIGSFARRAFGWKHTRHFKPGMFDIPNCSIQAAYNDW